MTINEIRSDIDFILQTSSYADADKIRNINRRLEEVVSIILQSDARWQWDDTNYTDLPIGTTTLVDGQQDYEITGATFLYVTEVAVKDQNGKYQILTPVDRNKGKAQALEDLESGNNGMPRYYDKLGNSIFLYPKPAASSVTLAEGLKVSFQRNPSFFSTSDTTKSPGFAPLYHRILSFGAALDYAVAKGMRDKVNVLQPLLTNMQDQMITFYSQRSKDESVRLRTRKEDYGVMGDGTFQGRDYPDKVAFF